MRLFFGKIGKAGQIEKNEYLAGKRGSPWYGGLEPGDYVYPIWKGSIDRLWRVKEYVDAPNRFSPENPGAVTFEIIKEFSAKIPFVSFVRYKHFSLNLNLLNKAGKSVKGCGFFEIATTPDIPPPDEIGFSAPELRSLYIALDSHDLPKLDRKDVVVLIDNLDSSRIAGIKIFDGTELVNYDVLKDLYEEKNAEGERYTLHELVTFAEEDKAPKKLIYLSEVLEALGNQGYFKVEHPIALYDNVLVGRKRSHSAQIEDEDEAGGPTEGDAQYDDYASLLEHNPNLILYGPPGTGKTYSTQRIIEAFERRGKGSQVSIDQVRSEGRVQFVSFHQSYSYEEFVEGIRPILTDSDLGIGGSPFGGVRYEIQPGILLEIANAAAKGALTAESNESQAIGENARIWKVSLGQRNSEEAIYEQCKKGNYIAIGWLDDVNLAGKDYDAILEFLSRDLKKNDPSPTNDASTIDCLVNQIAEGDIVFIYDGPETIRDIGIVSSPYYFKSKDGNPFPHRRSVKWLRSFKKPQNIMRFNDNTRLTMKTVYPLSRISFNDIRSLLSEDPKVEQKKPASVLPPYYLIIDEINRGNIAKIFGELISIVEKDKREKTPCKLLYSRKTFTLPANLYFICTMNTADKSIAVLDTALRRRFTFLEMEPNPDCLNLSDETPILEDLIDLRRLLVNLNRAISEKIDREHRLGHSYFMGIVSLRDFHYRWYYQILPLLMDYFYGEIDKVKEIVGDAFFEDKDRVRYYSLPDERTEFVNALARLCEEPQ